MKAKRQNTKSTFCVIFVIQKGECRPDGTAPIVARITLNGEMVHFSTKHYIHPDRWLPLEYKTVGKTNEEKLINETLFDLQSTIKRKHVFITVCNKKVHPAERKMDFVVC